MPRIKIGPVGSISTGHVLDCAKAPLERALREYDSQLYLKWNPRKLKGHGCWELRRRPEEKTIKPEDVVIYKGNTYVVPKYHELGMVNHVMDVPFLNYSVLLKIKKMDTWTKDEFGYKGKNFAKEIEYIEAKYDEKVEDDAAKELEYNLKQHSSELRWFREYLLSGGDPTQIGKYWNES